MTLTHDAITLNQEKGGAQFGISHTYMKHYLQKDDLADIYQEILSGKAVVSPLISSCIYNVAIDWPHSWALVWKGESLVRIHM